jgi:2-polyprenyl-3-methyl-5-hydroxy-6-metoxy-1,4-benzoquinol methylase
MRREADIRSFDHMAEEYDFMASHAGKANFILDQLPERRSRALDVGCGSGRLAFELAQRFESVLAVDISEPMLELARRDRSAPNIEYRRADANELDVQGEFDAVVSHTTLHHMADLPATLEHLRSLVTPGGRLIVVDIVKGWLPIRPTVLRLSALLDFPLHARKHGVEAARRILRFRLSRHWVRHVQTDTFLTPDEYEDVYGGVLPGARLAPAGPFMSIVWERDAAA